MIAFMVVLYLTQISAFTYNENKKNRAMFNNLYTITDYCKGKKSVSEFFLHIFRMTGNEFNLGVQKLPSSLLCPHFQHPHSPIPLPTNPCRLLMNVTGRTPGWLS